MVEHKLHLLGATLSLLNQLDFHEKVAVSESLKG